MKYLIWVTQKDEIEKMFSAPVSTIDSDYFKREVLPSLTPISQDFYCKSFAAILQTLAKWSYILYQEKLYWCIEWTPGFIVLEFQPDGIIQGAALRSPIPTFGRRTPLPVDLENEFDDELYENHQYNLIFDAWDAQFDKQTRNWKKFLLVSKEDREQYDKCIRYIDNLASKVEELYQQDIKNFMQKSFDRIGKWAGEGKRTVMNIETPPYS